MAKDPLYFDGFYELRSAIETSASKNQFEKCVRIIEHNKKYFPDGVNQILSDRDNHSVGIIKFPEFIQYLISNNLFDTTPHTRFNLDDKIERMFFNLPIHFSGNDPNKILETCDIIAYHFIIDKKTHRRCMDNIYYASIRDNDHLCRIKGCVELMYQNYLLYKRFDRENEQRPVLVFPEGAEARIQAMSYREGAAAGAIIAPLRGEPMEAEGNIVAPGGPGAAAAADAIEAPPGGLGWRGRVITPSAIAPLYIHGFYELMSAIETSASKNQFEKCVRIIKYNKKYFPDGVNQILSDRDNHSVGIIKFPEFIQYLISNNLFDTTPHTRFNLDDKIEGMFFNLPNHFSGNDPNKILETCDIIARHFIIDKKTHSRCMGNIYRYAFIRDNDHLCRIKGCVELMYQNYLLYKRFDREEEQRPVLVFPEGAEARIQAMSYREGDAAGAIIAPGGPGAAAAADDIEAPPGGLGWRGRVITPSAASCGRHFVS